LLTLLALVLVGLLVLFFTFPQYLIYYKDSVKLVAPFLQEEGAEVVYLPLTPEISTTQIKQDLHK